MSRDQTSFNNIDEEKKEKSPANQRWGSLLDIKKAAEVEPEPQPAPVIAEPPVTEIEEVIYSVSDINSMIKKQVESNFTSIWLQGEISNFKAHTSGHYYFSLKDAKAQISAVMFKGLNSKLKFRPENGMEVVVHGKVTVYEPRGNYQVFCQSMEPVGAGALQKAFEQLKEKLQKEGLFEQSKKKALPMLPRHIGVVTSPTGAAIKDILNVLQRRYKGAKVTVIPARVQGDGAAEEVARGILLANTVADYDVLIVGRGGGSIEDLWCFNEEIVARAIDASDIPVISAVGHEIDYTIADFVADYRAPTPSAAAEVVAKSASELIERVTGFRQRLVRAIQQRLRQQNEKISHLKSLLVDPKRRLEDLSIQCDELLQRLQLASRRLLKERSLNVKLLRQKLVNPITKIQLQQQKCTASERRLEAAMRSRMTSSKDKMTSLMSMLNSLSPLQVVERGFAVVYRDKKVISKAENVNMKDELHVQLTDGVLKVEVKDKEEPWTLRKK